MTRFRPALRLGLIAALLTGMAPHLQAFPRILSTKGSGPALAWPEETTYLLLRLRQDPLTDEVAIMLESTNNLEFGTKMAGEVADWLYGPSLPWADAATEGLLLLVGGARAANVELLGLEPMTLGRVAAPEYPPHLFQLGLEGVVTLSGVIRPDGRPDGIRVESYAHPEFAAAAVRTWSQSVYGPARLNGEPVATLTQQSFRFQINPGAVERRFFGLPERQIDLDRAAEGDTPSFPTLLRFCLPPYPAELYPAPRPESVTITVRVGIEGTVTGINVDEVPEPWREPMEDILKTWLFTPGVLGDDPIPLRVNLKLDLEEPYPDLIRAALRDDSVLPVEMAGESTLLMADLDLPFDLVGAAPAAPMFVELDLLVAPNGVVAATRLVDTNHPGFARHIRSRAAYSVYAPSPRGTPRIPVWIRQRYQSANP